MEELKGSSSSSGTSRAALSEEHFEIAIAGSSRGSEEPLPPPGFADFARQNLLSGGCPGPGMFECYLHAVFSGLPAAVIS